MMKAMAAKEGMKEKASNFQAPNLQELGGNLMQNVTNLIPGRKEEDVGFIFFSATAFEAAFSTFCLENLCFFF